MGDLIVKADVTDRRLSARPDLALLISAASGLIETHCNRTFAQALLVELHDGKDLGRVWLRRPPVGTITDLSVNGSSIDNTDGYAWTVRADTGELRRGPAWGDVRFAGRFPCGSQNVQVSYTGGYLVIPAPVKAATVQLVKHMADSMTMTGLLKSEEIGDWKGELNLDAADWPPLCLRLLEPFVL